MTLFRSKVWRPVDIALLKWSCILLGMIVGAYLSDFIKDYVWVFVIAAILDKDGIIKPFPLANESDYLPQPPTSKEFSDCCNEFWWVCPYAPKGLWREEIIDARFMSDQLVREQLMKMATWYIGMKTGFSINPGKFGKYFQKHLEPELWELLLKTYSDADYDHSWETMLAMGTLFRRTAIPVAKHFGFDYPYGDDERVSAHLEHVRNLPKDAQEIY